MRLLIILLLVSSSAMAERINLYIVAGQSNAVGQGTAPQPSWYQPIPDCYSFYSGSVQPLSVPTCGGQQHGIETSFAIRMRDRTGDPVCIVKVAQNGSSLAPSNPAGPFGTWDPFTDGSLFWQMIASANQASAQLAAMGHQSVLSGIVWYQGESDGFGASNEWQQYHTRLHVFVEAARIELGRPGLPFIIMQLSTNVGTWWTSFYNIAGIRSAQQQLSLSGTALVNIDDLYTADIHLQSPGLIEAGIRAANAMPVDIATGVGRVSRKPNYTDKAYMLNGQEVSRMTNGYLIRL